MRYPTYTDFTLILFLFSYCQLDAFCHHFNKVPMYACNAIQHSINTKMSKRNFITT